MISFTQMASNPVTVALPHALPGDKVLSAHVVKGAYAGTGPAVGSDMTYCYAPTVTVADRLDQVRTAGVDVGSVIMVALSRGETQVDPFPPRHPVPGQLWWNTKDGQLYIYTGWQWVAASCCDCTQTPVSATPPPKPVAGTLWWNSSDGQLYIFTGTQWVAASCCDQSAMN
jgi:hypothetical protein